MNRFRWMLALLVACLAVAAAVMGAASGLVPFAISAMKGSK